MLLPVEKALQAFLIMFSLLPAPFISFIVWAVSVTVLIRLLLVVISL